MKPRERTKTEKKSSTFGPFHTLVAIQRSPYPTDVSYENIGRKETQMLYHLTKAYEKFESPTDYELKKLTVFCSDDLQKNPRLRILHFIEMTALNTNLSACFVKEIPGINIISKRDQITLLQESALEVLLLWSIRKYDRRTHSLVFGKKYNKVYKFNSLTVDENTDFSHRIFDFIQDMSQLELNNIEYALLSAILILTERSALIEPHKVNALREEYIQLFRKFITANRPSCTHEFVDYLTVRIKDLFTLANRDDHKWLESELPFLSPFLIELLGI